MCWFISPQLLINPFLPNGIPLSYQLDQSISVLRAVGWYFSNSNRISWKKNNGDPDQRPHSAASGLGLGCLPMSHKKDARLIWVNKF